MADGGENQGNAIKQSQSSQINSRAIYYLHFVYMYKIRN